MKSRGWVLVADMLGFKNEMSGKTDSIEGRIQELLNLWSDIQNKVSFCSLLVSDSMFIHWSCQDDSISISKSFNQARADIRTLLDRFTACDFLLRGAMTYGDVIITETVWAGEALFSAHRIESTVLNAPLVAIPERYCANVEKKYLVGVPVRDLPTKSEGIQRFRLILPNKVQSLTSLLVKRYDDLAVNGPADAAKKVRNAIDELKSQE